MPTTLLKTLPSCLLPEEELRLLQLLHIGASLTHVCGYVGHHITGDAEEAAHQDVLLELDKAEHKRLPPKVATKAQEN